MTEPERIYVSFSDDGERIRKWSRAPFYGAVEYVQAGFVRDAEPSKEDTSHE